MLFNKALPVVPFLQASPRLAITSVVNFLFRLVLGVAVALLQTSFELVLLARDDIEIVVSELAPLLPHFAFTCFQLPLDAIPVHDGSLELNRSSNGKHRL
jgi:hypothetical protein